MAGKKGCRIIPATGVPATLLALHTRQMGSIEGLYFSEEEYEAIVCGAAEELQ